MNPAISTESYREKALRKFKQQPLVPVGTGTFSNSFCFRPKLTATTYHRLYRGSCHDRRARNRDDENAQRPVALLQQVVACTYRRAGTHCRRRCRRLMGVRYLDSCTTAGDSSTGQGSAGSGRVRRPVTRGRRDNSGGIGSSVDDRCTVIAIRGTTNNRAPPTPIHVEVMAVMVAMERVEKQHRQVIVNHVTRFYPCPFFNGTR